MVFLLIKFFAKITYQWIIVTQPLLQQPHFHPSLCPTRAWGLVSCYSVASGLPFKRKSPINEHSGRSIGKGI